MLETTFFATPQMFFIKQNMIFFQKPPKTSNIYVYCFVQSDICGSNIF